MRRWRGGAVSLVAVVALLGSVLAPGASTIGDAAFAVNGGGSLEFVIAPGDVTCLDNAVVVTSEGGSPEEFTSYVKLNAVADGYQVESSWSVTPDGGPAIPLGTALTPVVNPDGLPTPANPYNDTVYFPAGAGGDTFVYLVSLQLREPSGTVVGAPVVQEVSCPTGDVTAPAVPLGAAAAVPPGEPGQAPVVVAAPPGPQPIAWQPCASPEARDDEECGTLLVPRDHFADVPGDETFFAIALNRIPAVGASRGVLLTNPGGPGAPGLGVSRDLAAVYDGTPLRDYDIIGMDPRGIGDSRPNLACMAASPLANLSALGNPLTPDWGALFAADIPVVGALNSSCSVATARYLGYLGTRQVAADMDWVRRAEDARRGNERPLAYFGGSYGTRIGEVYLQQFGDKAGPFVLSGAVNPSSTYEQYFTQRSGPANEPDIETAIDQVLEDWFFPAAPPPTRNRFFAVVDALNYTPPQPPVVVPVVIGGQTIPLTLPLFLLQVQVQMGNDTSMPGLADFINGVFAAVVQGADVNIAALPEPEVGLPLPWTPGDPTPGEIGTLDAGGLPPVQLTDSQLILNVVNCTDLPGVPADAAAMTQAAEAAIPPDPAGAPNYLGWIYPVLLSACTGLDVDGGDASPKKVWPANTLPAGTPAPLVIGSVGDTLTPYTWSSEMTRFFTDRGVGAALLTYEGSQHVAGLGWPPGRCVGDPVVSFFASGALPAAGTTCPFISIFDRLPPTGVQATAGDGQATITWVPTPQAAQRLGGTVEGFAVEQRLLPDGDWTDVDGDDGIILLAADTNQTGSCDAVADDPEATTCTVTGLANGSTYEFRVLTLPVYLGPGIPSASSNAVTPGSSPVPPGPSPVPPGPSPAPGPSPVPAVVPRFTG